MVIAASMPHRIVEERGLAGLRTAGDDDVEPGCDRRREERGRVNGQRPELDELVEMVRAHHELADVDRPVSSGDVRDYHVEPVVITEDASAPYLSNVATGPVQPVRRRADA